MTIRDRRDDPARHLLRAASGQEGGRRMLSSPTGMARMRLEQRAVRAGEELTLRATAGAEGFIYVLAGHGTAVCGAERLTIAPGDFVGLEPGEAPALSNTGPVTLMLLIGFAGSGS